MKFIACLILSVLSTYAIASPECEERKSIDIKNREIISRVCKQAPGKYQYSIIFEGKTLVQTSSLFEQDLNRQRSIWIYSGTWENNSALFLLDLSTVPPKTWVFGVGQSTNEFDYASWGKKNSVIAIKDNVRFTYQDHRFILPDAEFAASHSYADTRNWIFSKDGKVLSMDLDPKKNVPFAKEIDPNSFK